MQINSAHMVLFLVAMAIIIVFSISVVYSFIYNKGEPVLASLGIILVGTGSLFLSPYSGPTYVQCSKEIKKEYVRITCPTIDKELLISDLPRILLADKMEGEVINYYNVFGNINSSEIAFKLKK